MNSTVLYTTPAAVTRLGSDLFLKLPLYKTRAKIRPVYINAQLFRTVFAMPDAPLNWQQMADVLIELFSCSLDKQQSTGEQHGWAYVDRQADPLGIALNGNLGSGRAYYTGAQFNIKGEKTPLATSASENHSDGILDFADAIWNTIVANSLEAEIETGLSPVLAVFDFNAADSSAKIIRIDSAGSLDRITHIFYKQQQLTEQQFLAAARAMGKYEAEKFIHRILHGSWSAGNISLDGHLIDYDSVSAVKGRQPQFGVSSYHVENFFGFEYRGQLLVLESLVVDQHINVDKVSLEALRVELLASFNLQVATRLAYLIGFEDYSDIYTKYSAEFAELAGLFLQLARYVRYAAEKSFYINLPTHFLGHLLDFSAFFRIYPLLKQNNKFSLEAGLLLLGDSVLLVDEADTPAHDYFDGLELQPSVLAVVGEYLVKDAAQLEAVRVAALDFLRLYDELFSKIVAENSVNVDLLAARAYVINEDRFYMFPVFDLSRIFNGLAAELPSQVVNDRLQLLINANQRTPIKLFDDYYVADLRLFVGGYSCVLLDGAGGFRIMFALDRDKFNGMQDSAALQIEYNNTKYVASIADFDIEGYLCVVSASIATSELIPENNRDAVFLMQKFTLYSNGAQIQFMDLYLPGERFKYYLTGLG